MILAPFFVLLYLFVKIDQVFQFKTGLFKYNTVDQYSIYQSSTVDQSNRNTTIQINDQSTPENNQNWKTKCDLKCRALMMNMNIPLNRFLVFTGYYFIFVVLVLITILNKGKLSLCYEFVYMCTIFPRLSVELTF